MSGRASSSDAGQARLLATSDIHVSHPDNRPLLEALRPTSADDWLLVVGDVAESPDDVAWALRRLRDRFARVIWVPGNHELWTVSHDPVQLRGEARYHHLVEMCRGLGVDTPEDPYPVWDGPGGPAVVAPLFLLYDHSFGRRLGETAQAALSRAERAGVVLADQHVLKHDPYPSLAAWCHARVTATELRLGACDPALPTVLVNHFPLVAEPTRTLRLPEIALWSGTTLTADWHVRYRALVAVYGHLHIPRTTIHDGVRFEEVSVGYPREWQRRGHPRGILRQILPAPSP